MRLLPTLLLVVANALWGASYVVAKVALEEIPAPLLAALRFSIASFLLCALTLARVRLTRKAYIPPAGDLVRLMALGVLGVAVERGDCRIDQLGHAASSQGALTLPAVASRLTTSCW